MSTKTPRFADMLADAQETKPKKKPRKASGSWDVIYKFVRQIPRGSVITYGGVAKRIRLRGGSRVVGYAMASTPNGSGIPWHRVIGAGGHLRLNEPLVSLQRKLLESEGVTFIGRRADIDRHLWRKKKARRARKKQR